MIRNGKDRSGTICIINNTIVNCILPTLDQMPDQPDKLTRFWKELKRRKVIRVITVYAAAAYVILELVSIIAEPLGLPGWSLPLVIVLLCIGFVIAAILSWIYDVTPEGLAKTDYSDLDERKIPEKPPGILGWKIATSISLAVLLFLILYNIFKNRGQSESPEILEKSIAVLPFRNDSPDKENEYFMNGIMEEVLINLQAIKDFKVPGRTSVEKFRNSEKSTPEIAEELGVSYIVESSGQKYGDTIVLRVQLLERSQGMHLWGKQFKQEIKSTEAIIGIQSLIARSIARELRAVITPEEQKLIERVPTANLTAYDFYQQAEEYIIQYRMDPEKKASLSKARALYYRALENDTGFAQAYTGLAKVYFYGHYVSEYFLENFLDSVLSFADKALQLDNRLADAYLIRGEYYRAKGDTARALNEYDRVLRLNSSAWEAYRGKGLLFTNEDHIESIKNLLAAYSLYHGPELPDLLRQISTTYAFAGFYDHSQQFAEGALELDGDSILYLNLLATHEGWQGQYRQAIFYSLKSLALDSTDVFNLDRLAYNYMFAGEFSKALKFYRKVEGNELELNDLHRIAYVYSRNGMAKEASRFFRKQEDVCRQMIELERPAAKSLYTYYDLAGVYAFLGEKEKALENLRIFNKRTKQSGWMVTLIQDDPLFDSIRGEAEFQQIVQDVKSKYTEDYNRVRAWLFEQGLL